MVVLCCCHQLAELVDLMQEYYTYSDRFSLFFISGNCLCFGPVGNFGKKSFENCAISRNGQYCAKLRKWKDTSLVSAMYLPLAAKV